MNPTNHCPRAVRYRNWALSESGKATAAILFAIADEADRNGCTLTAQASASLEFASCDCSDGRGLFLPGMKPLGVAAIFSVWTGV
jgi:hypothetical protein